MTRKEWKRSNTSLWLTIAFATVYAGGYRTYSGSSVNAETILQF